MKKWLIVVFLSSLACLGAFAEKADSTIQTSVCEIVTHPKQFEGKSVRVRAQIWWYGRVQTWAEMRAQTRPGLYPVFWLNEAWDASSSEFFKACRWLPAEFTYPTNLAFSTAFGTFTGKLIRDPKSSGGMLLLIKCQSDIYRQQLMNGIVWNPLVYDAKSRTFFRPE